MTKREKILIYIAGIAIFLFIFIQFLIVPMYKTSNTLNDQLVILTEEKQALDMKFSLEEATRENYEQSVKSFEAMQQRYPIIVPNEDVDRIITNMCIENRLTPLTLGMSQASPRAYGDLKSQPQNGEDIDADFTVVNASMTLKGSYETLKNLITATERYEHIRITKIAFSTSNGITNDDITANTAISVTFEVTMLRERQ